MSFDDLPVPDFAGFGLRTTPCSPVENRRWVARLVDVYDGDTMTCIVRLDCGEHQRITVRLLGVDTCELRATDQTLRKLAVRARDVAIRHLASPWLPRDTLPPLVCFKSRADIQAALDGHVCYVGLDVRVRDKYGRYLCRVFPLVPRYAVCGDRCDERQADADQAEEDQKQLTSNGQESLGEVLLRERLAYPYSGGRRLTEAEELAALVVG